MKLLYLANARIPTEKAHGLQIMKTCEALAAEGITVTLAVAQRRNEITLDPFEYYEVRRLFTLRALPSFDTVRYGKVGFWLQRISYVLSACVYALFARADVLYSRDIFLCAVLGAVGFRVVYEDHEPLKNHGIYTILLRRIPHKVLVAAHLKTLYETLGISLRSTVVAPNGTDLEEFERIPSDRTVWSREYGISVEQKIVLYTGHMYPWKGTSTLFESAQHLSHDVTIVCVGGNREARKAAEKYIRDRALPRICFIDFAPHAKVVQLLKSADVLVLPNTAQETRSRSYTTPLKLFEYMASGVPIVASRIPSFGPYLEEGKNALLCDPDSSQDLARAILATITDPSEGKKRAAQAFLLVQEYSWRARARRIHALLSSRA